MLFLLITESLLKKPLILFEIGQLCSDWGNLPLGETFWLSQSGSLILRLPERTSHLLDLSCMFLILLRKFLFQSSHSLFEPTHFSFGFFQVVLEKSAKLQSFSELVFLCQKLEMLRLKVKPLSLVEQILSEFLQFLVEFLQRLAGVKFVGLRIIIDLLLD